ncbi:xanthine dehydrogenase accessory protein XdhC [Sulfitobacter sp. LCG007]
MSALWVEVKATRGSCPRDAGAAMKVTETSSEGTIGGGALELRAIELARGFMQSGVAEVVRSFPLGPDLGQCCGGSVTLRFTRDALRLDPAEPAAATVHEGEPLPLWLWGAGHVGRAVVRAAQPQAFDLTWIDDAAARFPDDIPEHVDVVPAADMATLAARAPAGVHHLVFTYSHDIDFAVTAALLGRQPASLGLIGSATKRARFFKRLRAMGLDPAPVICPIGDKSLGKRPDQIARGTIAALLAALPEKARA